MHNKILIIFSLFVAFTGILLILHLSFREGGRSADNNSPKTKITLYKSPNCGCCVKYVSYLKKQGFTVETIPTNDMSSIKTEHQIPRNMESCHTMVIGNYFIEGHVPLEAVNKLLVEKPDIDGISLPDMPAGTPGMPGIKQGKWQVYSLKDGQPSEYMSL